MKSDQKEVQKNTCPSNQENQEDSQSSASLHFDLLTLNDRKNSQESELISLFKDGESCYSIELKEREKCRKIKSIQKREREAESEKKQYLNKKRRITYLENKVEELEREIASLRRNEYSCHCCRNRLPEYYRERLELTIQSEESVPNVAGDTDAKKNSKDSLEFEKIDFHTPLIQSQEMEEKLWIFVGTMLIAMGSKVTDFDGTINIFKVMKQSVDHIRRQVEKCEPKIGLEFYCCKEEMNEPHSYIDGMIFDPFYNQKQQMSQGHFSLQGIKLQSVEQYELFYESKFNFNIKYDALLTIIQFARDNCSIS